MEFVMFEDVDGLEVFVNPERVIWVREYFKPDYRNQLRARRQVCCAPRSGSCRCRAGQNASLRPRHIFL